MSPWLALAAMPMAGRDGAYTDPTSYWSTGDIGVTGLTTPGPQVTATNQLQTTYAAWNNVIADYDKVYNTDDLYQDPWTEPAFAYVPAGDPSKITTVFNDFVDRIVKMGEGTRVDASLSKLFNVYQMPGKPLFEIDGVDAGNRVSYNGKNIDWDLDATQIPLNGITTLSFYVKVDKSAAQEGLSYSILDTAQIKSFGRFYHDTENPGPVLKKVNLLKKFPPAYVKPLSGVIEQESSEADVTSDAPSGGYTGGDGHQDNRESANSTKNYMGSVLDVTPDISGLEIGTGLSGRSKAIVKVANGANMRYQWQVKNDSGEWEDIFGATSSQYTLSSKFAAGKEYELRCRITNAAGKITFTDSIKVTAEAATKGAGLQSK